MQFQSLLGLYPGVISDRMFNRVALLKSIPGMGSLMAIILLVELVDMNRFRSLDPLCSYVGLVPTERSSGEEDTHGSITPRSHAYLRSMLIECAWVAVRKDPALLMQYQHLTGRMSGQRAIIRIARKLLSRIRYVLKNQDPMR
jgi:transposase